MIDNPPILKIQRDFSRPSATAVDALRGTPTGFIVDCMEGRGALNHAIKSLFALESPTVGVAVTCECGPADNLGVYGALDIAKPGDVIVASTDSHMGTAVIGDLVLEMMKNKGVVGFVTDGLVRDLEGIERVALPIFCKGITPNSPARNGPATAGFPVNLDATHIRSGDVIVADRDGVVVVPADRLAVVCERLDDVNASEATLLQAVQSGLTRPEFFSALVESGKVVEVDSQN
jgi:4-hydroxy-4-methyl-2-oxoglutarate aldolase